MSFDPHYKWLGIPPEEQPASLYRLLGVRDFESDAEVIENAADQRMSHVRTFQSGKYADQSQRLLNELAAARVVLLSPTKRAAYDSELQARLRPKVDPQQLEPLVAAVPTQHASVMPDQGYGIQPVDNGAQSYSQHSPGTADASTFHRRQRPAWLIPSAIGGGGLLVFLAVFLFARLSGQPDVQPIAQNDPAPDEQPVQETDANPLRNTPTNSPLAGNDDSTTNTTNPGMNNAGENGTQPGSEDASGAGTSTIPATDIPETPVSNTGEPLTSARENGVLHYSFTSEDVLEEFDMVGDYKFLPEGGLDLLNGKPASSAATKQVFSFPIRIDYQVYCPADGCLDIGPGFGPIHLQWGFDWNKSAAVGIDGVRTRIRHRKIEANKLYHITLAIDSERKLSYAIDGSPVFLAQLSDDLELVGTVGLSGGIGHVVYKSVTISPDWQEDSTTAVPGGQNPFTTVGPPTEQTVYDFSSRATRREFHLDGESVHQFGELHIYSERQPLSHAFSRKEFGYPLEIRYQLYCLPERTAHVILGFGPVRLHWGFDKNTTTAVKIGDAHINVPNKPVEPAHVYKVSLTIDLQRTLRIQIDDELLFEDTIPPEVELAGPAVIGAGRNGWVAYDGAIVLPLAEE